MVLEEEVEKKKENFIGALKEINSLLMEKKCTARDILHISRELETNAMISIMFANLIRNIKKKKK